MSWDIDLKIKTISEDVKNDYMDMNIEKIISKICFRMYNSILGIFITLVISKINFENLCFLEFLKKYLDSVEWTINLIAPVRYIIFSNR